MFIVGMLMLRHIRRISIGIHQSDLDRIVRPVQLSLQKHLAGSIVKRISHNHSNKLKTHPLNQPYRQHSTA